MVSVKEKARGAVTFSVIRLLFLYIKRVKRGLEPIGSLQQVVLFIQRPTVQENP